VSARTCANEKCGEKLAAFGIKAQAVEKDGSVAGRAVFLCSYLCAVSFFNKQQLPGRKAIPNQAEAGEPDAGEE
jgi:hypothetical protein